MKKKWTAEAPVSRTVLLLVIAKVIWESKDANE